MKKYLFSYLSSFLIFCFLSCNQTFAGGAGQSFEESSTTAVSFSCWNAQTFFDSEIEGTEYSDYQNLAKWSKDKYLTRLSRLCEVMTALNSDIIVLEEIENAAVMQDIANQFAGNAWESKGNWSYACFSKEEGSAIGCGVFSKYELCDLKVHTLNIQTQSEAQPSTRPLLQVTALINDKTLVIFVNHWKSKVSGEGSGEIWRDWQENLLAEKIIELQKKNVDFSCVLCGDFNRDIREFVSGMTGSGENVLFRGIDEKLELYSPWYNSYGDYSTETGSYFYDGEWERIDHIFVTGNIKFSAFSPRSDSPWAASNSVPNAYKLYSGEGYSDHLPLTGILTLF